MHTTPTLWASDTGHELGRVHLPPFVLQRLDADLAHVVGVVFLEAHEDLRGDPDPVVAVRVLGVLGLHRRHALRGARGREVLLRLVVRLVHT